MRLTNAIQKHKQEKISYQILGKFFSTEFLAQKRGPHSPLL